MSSAIDLQSLVPMAQKLLRAAKPWATVPILGPAAYLLGVAILRNRRIKKLHKKYNMTSRESFSKMTDDEAWNILMDVAMLEFPFTYLKSIQFALFRTYGIPTISKTLVKTGQFAKPEFSLKRYADTGVLIAEFLGNPPSSARTHEAIARMNYLHSGYRMSGKILDDDMLYTLSLFAVEPAQWINKYEWRQLTDMEICALGTFWKSIGDAMQISFEKLPSCSTGFKDGYQFWQELRTWSQAYEAENMVPNSYNKENADQTVAVLLYDIPYIARPFARNAVLHLMDDRLRNAMMYEKANFLVSAFVSSAFSIRKFVLKYLTLPRPEFLRYHRISPGTSADERHFFLEWEGAPFYVKPTFMNRWGLRGWISWARGLPIPGDNPEHGPNGYLIKEAGPKAFVGKGQDQLDKTKERLKTERTGQCPFFVK